MFPSSQVKFGAILQEGCFLPALEAQCLHHVCTYAVSFEFSDPSPTLLLRAPYGAVESRHGVLSASAAYASQLPRSIYFDQSTAQYNRRS